LGGFKRHFHTQIRAENRSPAVLPEQKAEEAEAASCMPEMSFRS
jgi:hypothetical protein